MFGRLRRVWSVSLPPLLQMTESWGGGGGVGGFGEYYSVTSATRDGAAFAWPAASHTQELEVFTPYKLGQPNQSPFQPHFSKIQRVLT
jgi:hypothetical protein